MANNDLGMPDSSRPCHDNRRARAGRQRKPHKSLGVVYDQKFHGLLARPRRTAAAVPGMRGPFSALVECRAPVHPARLARFARALLENGCVALHVIGEPVTAAALSAAYDAAADDARFMAAADGLSPYSAVEDHGEPWRESLAEALSWFILPTGHTRTSLVATIGGDEDFARLIRHFAHAVGDLRERIVPCPPMRGCWPGVGGWISPQAATGE